MNRNTLVALIVIILVIVFALFSFGYLGHDRKAADSQPSPHALDQSQ